MTWTSVVVRGMPNANTVTPPTKTCSTRLARRTPSAVLRTSSRLRLLGGIAQAPRGFDEFESHFQRLAWSETSRPEGSGAHCYLYQNGSELMKDEIRLDVPRDCLVRRTVTPESPARFTLPVSASTFSALAVGAPGVNVTVDREQRSVTLRVDRAADVYFVGFGGTYLNRWPMPVIGYPPTSRSASSGPSTE